MISIPEPRKSHEIQESHTVKDASKGKIWWEVVLFVSFFHIMAYISLRYYTPTVATIKFMVGIIIVGALGITMGYHRLWSHNSYKASIPVKVALAFAGTLAFQGSIKWWGLRHRLHHRYTDTKHDPYDATRGFWYSHMGWMFEKQEYNRIKWIDKSDLDTDPVVQFQHKYYRELVLGLGIVMPTVVGLFLGDTFGGFLYGGFVARIFIWHFTWFINSLAHSWGEQEYSNENTSRGNIVLALLTMGEGHHNFHHEFPRDYRNGIKPLDWDPTKWLIQFCSFFGGTYDLISVPEAIILKAKVTTAQEEIDRVSKTLIWSDEAKLPTWTMAEYKIESSQSGSLILIDGFAIDISDFKDQHPGGSTLLTKYVGKDASKSFYGVLNNHTKSARQMMIDMRVAKVLAK
ncbi:hypothetical protein HDV02_001328 [Globomyces sp. JEL0801]|nr:hypothetical protein HDV02_001328 [Globomyces sp. JEL0801]